MISALICLSFLAQADKDDELLKSLEKARKVGLPVTAEERAGPPLTPGIIANQKLMDSYINVSRGNRIIMDPRTSTQKTVSQKGWKEAISIIERLAKSSEVFTRLTLNDSYLPSTSNLKGMVMMELIDSSAAVESKDFSKATFKLLSARRLLDNPVWNQSFVALLSGHAVQGRLTYTLAKIKASNPEEFKKLPNELFKPFMKPNFVNILRYEFGTQLTLLGGSKTLTRSTLPKDRRTVEYLRLMVKNWVLLYPELRGAINWTNLQTAYLKIEPELEKTSQSEEPTTFGPEYLNNVKNLDKRQTERDYKLQVLQRQ